MLPSELLQGRRIRTRLDLLKPSVTERVEQRQLQQKLSHDNTACKMCFSKGETVYAQNFGIGQKWMPGVVQEVTGPVSFLVKLQDGRLLRRHQDHLRHCVADDDAEKPAESDDIPKILIDSYTVAPSSHGSGDGPKSPLQMLIRQIRLELVGLPLSRHPKQLLAVPMLLVLITLGHVGLTLRDIVSNLTGTEIINCFVQFIHFMLALLDCPYYFYYIGVLLNLLFMHPPVYVH